MSNKPVLVLDGHSRAALETLQSLGRAGVVVDVAVEAADCLAFHSRYVSEKLKQPPANRPAAFASWLREQDRQRAYDLIVPATEASLLGLRALAEDDPLRRKAVLPANAALDITLDKEKTRALASDLGIAAPQTRLLSSADEIGQASQFPLVLKPAHSKVMIGGELRTLAVAVVKDESQRRDALQRWLAHTAVLEQAYIQGWGVGAEFLFDRGRKVWNFVHERVHEYPLSGGASSYRRSIKPPAALLRDAEALLTALHWHGVAMVEFKMDANGRHWLMEINPRLWGSLALSIDAGVNFPLGLLQLARGEQPADQTDYRLVYTRDLPTDLEWFKANLRANHKDPLLLTRSRALALLEFLRPLTGRESWDHFDWRDLGVTRRNLAQAIAGQVVPVLRKLKNRRVQWRWLRHHRAVLRRIAASGRPKKIVFLCYGNICRSPLAAGLAEHRLAGVAIASAGFHQHTGRSSPEKILRIASAQGIDLSKHRSARVTREQLLNADLVVAMDLENIKLLKREFPEALSRTTLLGLFAEPPSVSIADPYLADEATTGRICDLVRAGVEGLAGYLDQRSPLSLTSNITSEAPAAGKSS